jgi:hypothetical protein
LAGHHVTRLCASGRTVMIQPYLPAVDTAGETALIYFAGQLSHAIRKGPMLDGPDLGEPGLYKVEQIDARAPTRTETELGRDVLDVACRQLGIRPDDLLYARVDLIPGEDAAPLLVELELTEPSLFLGTSPGAPARFAAAIKAWLDRG